MLIRGVLVRLARAIFVSGFVLALGSGTACCQEIRVTLLGTGGPGFETNRSGPSVLVEAGGKKFLFDAGRGAIERLAQAKIKWQDVDGVFFTHLHSDHVVGFPDAWLTGWLVGAGRNRPLDVWGPPGTASMVSHLEQAFAFDIHFRILDDKLRPEGAVINAHEINPGIALELNGLKITAIKVDHAPVNQPMAIVSTMRADPSSYPAIPVSPKIWCRRRRESICWCMRLPLRRPSNALGPIRNE